MIDPDPDALIVIDFETFYDSDFTLNKMNVESYVRDPRFEVIGVAISQNGEGRWMEEAEFRKWVGTVDWSGVGVLAHNTLFDGFILSHHYGVRRPYIWFDTQSMARAFLPADVGGSLEKLAEFFKVGVKGKEVVLAKGMRRKDFDAHDWARFGLYAINDAELCGSLFWAMVDVLPSEELWVVDATLDMACSPAFEVDQPMLEEFVVWEQKRKQELLDHVAREKSSLMSNDKFAALLFEMGVEPPTKISVKKSARAGRPVETWAFAKSDVGMQVLLEHPNDEIRWLAEARVGVKSTINETRAQRFLNTGKRGTMPVLLKYHGAHTSRWSGSGKLNQQNLPRVPKEFDETKPYAGVLRKCLRAPPGMEIVTADSRQIEVRVLAWVSGHEQMVAQFADPARDIYSEQGSGFFGETINKDTHPEERQTSKNLVLGCGFGMGWFKLAIYMLQGMNGAKPMQFTDAWAERLGVDIEKFADDEKKMERVRMMPSRLELEPRVVHCAVSDHFIRKYRQQNKPVSEFWNLMEAVLEAMLVGDGTVAFGADDCCVIERHAIRLPNGLVLRYPGLRKSEEGDFSYMGGPVGKARSKVYGGLMTENLVQALALVVVSQQMLKMRELGWMSKTVTHDELVYVVNDADVERCKIDALRVMRTPPAWAPTMPLDAEVHSAQTYGDAK